MRHLTGYERIDNPYRLIAADATNDSEVSALDILEIRRLLLGNIDNFSNNTSWRFVDESYEFIDPFQPWEYPEMIDLSEGMSMSKNFVGVKVGDLNGTVVANALQAEIKAPSEVLTFNSEEADVRSGDDIEVHLRAEDFKGIYGYQFTIQTLGLRLTEIESGVLNMSEGNIGRHSGMIAVSWSNAQATSVEDGEVLFTLHFRANTDGRLSQMITANSEKVSKEAYRISESQEYESLDIALVPTSSEQSPEVDVDVPEALQPEFELFQNTPNPFANETVIAFNIPEDMPVELSIYNAQGQQVFTRDVDATAGMNTVTVNSRDLSAKGVLLYHLKADGFTATKKMVVLE
jgi:hypothetical protein